VVDATKMDATRRSLERYGRRPSIRRRFGFLIPGLLCGVVDVEYLHRIFSDAVKDFVG
jgi:hypothetical protein